MEPGCGVDAAEGGDANTAAKALGDLNTVVVSSIASAGSGSRRASRSGGRIRPMAMSRQVSVAAITQAAIQLLPPIGQASASTLATMSGSPVRRRSAGTR